MSPDVHVILVSLFSEEHALAGISAHGCSAPLLLVPVQSIEAHG